MWISTKDDQIARTDLIGQSVFDLDDAPISDLRPLTVTQTVPTSGEILGHQMNYAASHLKRKTLPRGSVIILPRGGSMPVKRLIKICGWLCFLSQVAFGSSEFERWLTSQTKVSQKFLLENVSPKGTSPGAVIAAPNKKDPNYYFHWVRDAGIVMNLVVSFYENGTPNDLDMDYEAELWDYAAFTRKIQVVPNLSEGLGEPLFNVDGTAVTFAWGRPQTDGPALRAISLVRFANDQIKAGNLARVKALLYDGKIPTYSVIESDLEFICFHWKESSFDPWEEVRGNHFFNRMVQRKALLDGAELADKLADDKAAKWYRYEARALEGEITKHWDSNRKVLLETLGRTAGIDYKSGLDSAVILGILMGDTHDQFLPVFDDRALATSLALKDAFQKLYPINQKGPGIAIGRYPEDEYDGVHTGSAGNPWVLTTAALGEFHYRVAKGLTAQGELKLTDINVNFFRSTLPSEAANLTPGKSLRAGQPLFKKMVTALRNTGDSFLKRIQFHKNADGSLSEQINRYTGFMQGAPKLTWSSASVITAIWERP
jgi:glucoamylase